MKNLLSNMTRSLVVFVILFIALFSTSHSLAADENAEFDIQSYVDDMQPGWNLGNTFDAVGEDETAWGNPRVTKELIEQIAAQGYKSIRIPVTFDQRMEGGPDYTINEDFLARVEQAVEWSLEEDMYVMINIHHDSWVWLEEGMHENHDESLARYNAIWTQLSEHFKDFSHKLMFESINEPRFWGSDDNKNEYLYELNTSFYEIVRESGGNNDVRPLVLPTLDTGSEPDKLNKLYDTIVELDDPNLISTVHYYGYWPFSVNIAGTTRFDEQTKDDIINTFDRVYEKFTANGIPVIIGEFGLLGFDTDITAVQQGEKLKFFEYMIHYAQEKQMTHMLWDNGQHFGRTSFQWSDSELYHMMKTSWKGRSATAESDFIFLKQDEEIYDVEIGLNLHGNEFRSLQLDSQDLIKGQDYDLNGDTLVIKASLLSDLTSSGELGKNAELTVKFNQGVDWRLDVIRYDISVLDSAEGTASDFSIPTQFNGDQLATMEAVYDEVDPDGNPIPAGPQNWTTFKEYAYTFSPLYDENKIIFKENFFNEIDDDKEVHLTFHFWSGETLDYTLIKNGDHVIGVYEGDQVLPDVSDLTELIESAEAISNENNKYTEESFNALQEAIENAKLALEIIDNEEDLQKEITVLQEAIDGLVEIKEPTPLNISELKELIKLAGAISNEDGKYTEESFNVLQDALAHAKSVVETIDTEEDLEKEITALQTAIDGLKEIDKPIEKEPEIVDDQNNVEGTPEVDNNKKPADQDGEVLPKTATSMYTILLVGGILLIIGALSLLFLKKKRLEQ